MKILRLICLALMLTALIISCQLGTKVETGSLGISINAPGMKNILPDEPMVCDAYEVTLAGPTPVGPVIVSGDTQFDDLLPGNYTVTVIGLNVNSLAIGAGSNTVTVNIAQVAPCPVTVAEYDGTGTLDLTVTWDSGVLNIPGVTGSMTPAGGVETPITYTLGTDQATYSGTYARGWFVLITQIWDDSQLAGGFVEAVRIAANITTTGTVHTNVSAGMGSLEVLITPDFWDEFTVNADVPPESTINLMTGCDPVVINVTAEPAVADVWTWYVNGNQVGVGAAYTINEGDFTEGMAYRLDVVGFSADGKHGGSTQWEIAKYGLGCDEFSIEFTASAAGIPFFAEIQALNRTPIATVTGTTVDPASPTTFVINGTIPEGEYMIFVCEDTDGNSAYTPGEPYEYWQETGDYTASTHVFVPHDPADIFDFGLLSF